MNIYSNYLFYLCIFLVTIESKYIIKKKPKVTQLNEFGVPEVPGMAFDVYPGIELHTLDGKYSEMLPGQDIAQIETMVGKVLPMNAALTASVTAQMTLKANINQF
jgi:hypothetical protein